MLPARHVLVGASRWLDLLATSSPAQAQEIFMASAQYSDLTLSHYAEAYDWVLERGFIEELRPGVPSAFRIFEAALEAEDSGLGEIEVEGLPSPGFLPAPIIDASRWLDIPDADAWRMTIAANYKIDLERRSRIGAFGEKALVHLLESAGCRVYHGSVDSDGLGWDVMASYGPFTKHIEVKTTTSIARLRVYLSRHEYEVSVHDSAWVLVVVLITDEGHLQRLAHVNAEVLARVVPVDRPLRGKWQVCSIDLQPVDLKPGLPIDCADLPHDGIVTDSNEPVWWPPK